MRFDTPSGGLTFQSPSKGVYVEQPSMLQLPLLILWLIYLDEQHVATKMGFESFLF